MVEIIIRDARSADVDIVWALAQGIAEFETSPGTTIFWPLDILSDCIDKPDVIFKIAEIDGEVIGFMILNLNLSLRKGLIENMFVTPEFRGRTVGKSLLRDIATEARERGIEYIVGLENEAVGFLESSGFMRGKTFTWMDLVLDNKFNK